MKYSAKNFIKRRVVNMVVITIISFLIGIGYLGFHKANIRPVEKSQEIEVIPEK